ncbi:MAG TPA: WecB/TagA/CpsF family glycosyltransferase [Candidatus Saccharimonadales bacterium]|nr:WecB/TagA/CpsF family glycosyltransferase [Candidatus Saccharimonadales bacterium]
MNINILGVGVADIGQKESVKSILSMAKSGKGHQVVTVNPEMIMLARRNRQFFDILKHADLKVADGQWVVWSKLILGGKSQERVTGVDLIDDLCAKSAKKAITVGFLGGFKTVAELVKVRQIGKYPGLKVVYAGSGDKAIGPDLRLKGPIFPNVRIDILFVAYGMGRQEFFIDANKNSLNVGVFVGVGGAFNYIAGNKMRSPKFLQSLGFEWAWRLLMEPTRARRMLRVFPMFWILVFLQKISQKN